MGGSDVCPESYGEKALRPEWNGDRIRDDYEIALLRAFMAQKKPVLGVCRGAQVINVAMGGTLYQDIATQLPQCAQPSQLGDLRRELPRDVVRSRQPASRGSTRARRWSRPTRSTTRRSRTSAATSSSRRGPSPTASSRRSAGRAPATCSPCSGTRSSTRRTTRSFIDDTPILDDFLAYAARHKAAAFAI